MSGARAGQTGFFGLDLFLFPPAMQKRIGAVIEDLDQGALPVEEVVEVVLGLIHEFIGSFDGDPQVAAVLGSLSGRKLGLQVNGLVGVTGTLAAGQKVQVEKGLVSGVPALVFRDLQTFKALLTGELDDVEALRSGRIQVSHMADFLKMLAPVVALQSKRKQEFKEQIQRALDRVLRERGY